MPFYQGIQPWIFSDAGPLVLMSERLVPQWGGGVAKNTSDGGANEASGSQNDYESACAITEYLSQHYGRYLGLLTLNSGDVLVLGGEPMQTTWFNHDKLGPLLVRWDCAESEEHVLQVLPEALDSSWTSEVDVFQVKDGDLWLFAAGSPGDRVTEYISMSLPSGIYTVSTQFFEPDEETSLVCHRFCSISP